MAGKQDAASREASKELTQLSEELGLYDPKPCPRCGSDLWDHGGWTECCNMSCTYTEGR